MSLARKITFLFFLLLALIVFCVYTNIKPYLDGTKQVVAVQQDELINEQKQEIEKSVEVEEPKQIVEKQDSLSTKQSDDTKITAEEVVEKQTEQEANKELLEEEALKQHQILRRIDTDYKRTNGELMYLDLSLNAQQIQDELYVIMKNNPIKFKNGSQRVAKGNEKTFEQIANILKANPKFMMEVAGHVFGKGEEKYDLSLSVLRAANVKKIMKKYGVKNRLKARGYGDNIPLVQDDIKLTNRIEFNIIGE